MMMKLIVFLLYLMTCHGMIKVVEGGRRSPAAGAARHAGSGGNYFNVKSYGARANGRTDDSKAFVAAWTAACKASGHVRVVVPSGTYFLEPVKFRGPCPRVQSLTFQVQGQGTLKASTNLKKYTQGDDWVEFGWVDHLIVEGGIYDGQGAVSWPFNKCPKSRNCKVLPTSILFVNTNNTIVRSLTSVNSKFFHMGVLGCQNFRGTNIKITAPAESPNTDGIHLERSTGVTIANSWIGTGDDCVSVGQGNSDVKISGIKCGPGHGISVGSLGRYKGEGDVTGLVVKDSILSGTDNGIRIKTWENSPTTSNAANMSFENIVMYNVGNPIIIDQTYCPFVKCDSSAPSRVKISNIRFRNIRGTSTTPVAVTLKCSKGLPCEKVSLHDVNLRYAAGGRARAQSASAVCHNVKADYTGMQNPPPCQ